jgi:lipopolysaccharide biosynthesis glycosyltransferase
MTDIKVFIGWDSREDIAFQVAKHSIKKHNPDVQVYPLKLPTLQELGVYTRGVDAKASTEFTFSRFFVPMLTGYKGWALFIDCDFLCTTDISELFKQANDNYAVMVAKHDYTPKEGTKMDGKQQLPYPRKNWSSCMLWNCEHPSNKLLDLNALNTNDGLWHHRFVWLADHEIGQISHEWNWLTDWYKSPEDGNPKMLHYTEGGPWFEHLQDVPYAQQWRAECEEYQASLQDTVEDKIARDDGGW